MTRISLLALVLAATIPFWPAAARTQAPGIRGGVPDSMLVARYLASVGFELDSIYATAGPFTAVHARNGTVHRLVVLSLANGEVTQLREPLEIRTAKSSTAWVSLRSDEVIDALVYTEEDYLEGLIGTRVFASVDSSFIHIYSDPIFSCVPARPRDLDGDGVVELVTFHEQLTVVANCDDLMALFAFEERFGVKPAFPRILKWNGLDRKSVV